MILGNPSLERWPNIDMERWPNKDIERLPYIFSTIPGLRFAQKSGA